MAIHAIFNQKGGVGKTSVTCNLAAASAELGHKTLVVDLDPSTNASLYMLGSKALGKVSRTIGDFFEETLRFRVFQESLLQSVVETRYKNLSIIASSERMEDIQDKLQQRYKVLKLGQALRELVAAKNFEVVFIDAPPEANFFAVSALLAADTVLIPHDCDAFSARALGKVVDLVDELACDQATTLKIGGIIINQFDSTAKLPSEAVKALMSRHVAVLEPFISASIVMKESHLAHRPLVDFRPKHRLSHQFRALAAKIVKGPPGLAAQAEEIESHEAHENPNSLLPHRS